MNKLFCVGYFINQPQKEAFCDTVGDGYERIYLDGITRGGEYDLVDALYYHAPVSLFRLEKKLVRKHVFKKIRVNKQVKSLYYRDLREYTASYIKGKNSLQGIKLRVISTLFYFINLCYRSYQVSKIKHPQSVVKHVFCTLGGIFKNYSLATLRNSNSEINVMSFVMKWKFVAGYNYYIDLVETIKPDDTDVFLFWGKEYSGQIHLLDLLRKRASPTIKFLEYGEIPGTIAINVDGMFGKSDIRKEWTELSQLTPTDEDKKYTETVLDKIDASGAAFRDNKQNYFELLSEIFVHQLDGKKIIYVNGCELFASGHIYNPQYINTKGYRNPNEYLLKRVCDEYDSKECMIIYREHPLTSKNSPRLKINKSKFPRVMHGLPLGLQSVLGITSLVVTFPSKVALTSLMMGIPTIIEGEFTLPSNEFSGLYGSEAFDMDLNDIASRLVDKDRCLNFIAIILKHKLIKVDRELYLDLDRMVEKNKSVKQLSDSQ